MNETASMGQSRQERVVFFGVWDKMVCAHFSDRGVDAILGQWLEKTS